MRQSVDEFLGAKVDLAVAQIQNLLHPSAREVLEDPTGFLTEPCD